MNLSIASHQKACFVIAILLSAVILPEER